MGVLFLIIVYTDLIALFLMAARDLRRQIEKLSSLSQKDSQEKEGI